MRSFQQRLPDFEARRIRVVGISVDPPDVNHRDLQKLGYTFPLLSDPNAKIIRRYDVLHPGAGPKSADIARPAEFLLRSELGGIAPGKRADLVLLSADPLADIHNTRQIQAVWLRGKYLDRTALDQLLAAAKHRHGKSKLD